MEWAFEDKFHSVICSLNMSQVVRNLEKCFKWIFHTSAGEFFTLDLVFDQPILFC